MVTYPSKLLENAVNEFAKLPGIGRKTALRLCLHLLYDDRMSVESFGNSLIKLRNETVFCSECHNLSDGLLCEICASSSRDKSIVCVVESIRDIMAIENTTQFNGVYHVLGGKISPIEGIGPDDLTISTLYKRMHTGQVHELVLALSATLEGDTTNYYLYRKLEGFNLTFSTLARGVSVGDELEYADEVTLGRSILNRTPYEGRSYR